MLKILSSIFTQNKTLPAKNLEIAKFKIIGMHCVSCGMNIDGNLEDLKGVIDADTNYGKSITTVKFDSRKITHEDLTKAISQAGYSSQLIIQKELV